MRVYCDQFNDPNHFDEVLAIFPRLKMCFAHLGLNAANKMNPQRTDRDVPALEWYYKIIELMGKYKQVYTDISYSAAYPGFCKWFKDEFAKFPEDIKDRVMFGTDFFMTVQEEKGNDKDIFDTVISELGIPLFTKLANENVTRYLTWKGLSAE